MKISVELTLTPLQDEFRSVIIHFIKKLRASNLKIIETPLSTQIYGDYDEVMTLLHTEIKETFELMENGVLNIKIVKSDRQDYKASF